MKGVKVLMLGWEFPPLFSGGLGVATYGLVKAMSSKASIKLIIPNNSTDNILNNVNIVGLNQVSSIDINLEAVKFDLNTYAEVHKVPVTLSPYHHTNEVISKIETVSLENKISIKNIINTIHDVFSSKDVYGFNIMHKVNLFASLAEEISVKSDFEIIHAHDWITYPAGIRIKKRTGKPLVVHVHALETDRAGEQARNEIYYMEKETFLIADRIIAVSQFTKGQLIKHYGIDPNKINVVHNGIDPVKTKRNTHLLKDKIVVFLGRITGQKGPQFLLETAEKVSKVYPRVKFVVAGTGDQFAPLLDQSAYKKLGSKFIFTGFINKTKVNELLSMADVYFMPSVSEPFGLTALEAAQYSVPSVLSAQSGAAEVMKGSLQADFWDTSKYANYIFALLNYAALGKELTTKASQEIEVLTWEHAADRLTTIYNDLITK